ncbi:hypothetical protein HZS_7317, partial [Henneguya salminicola]
TSYTRKNITSKKGSNPSESLAARNQESLQIVLACFSIECVEHLHLSIYPGINFGNPQNKCIHTQKIENCLP